MTLGEIERSISRIGEGWDAEGMCPEYGRMADIENVLLDLVRYLKEQEKA